MRVLETRDAHVGKMAVFYKRGRVEHSARRIVSPLSW